MTDPTGRTLHLLSLFQRRRHWAGPELADRLGVSERTLRRDVDRLRTLGYTVEATRGASGGYQLGASTSEAALLLDDDEAVALAASLHAAAAGTSDLAEASLSALAKVLAMLGPAQRRRADVLLASTTVGADGHDPAPPLAVLDAVATACRDEVRLSFGYVAGDGAASQRYVEPLRLVAVARRWYLVAFDVDRADWRTFRLDRMTDPTASRNTFTPRPPPAPDLARYVGSRRRDGGRHRVVLEVATAGDRLRQAYGPWVDVEDLAPNRCRVTMQVDAFTWPVRVLADIEAEVLVVEPDELRAHLADAAARLASAATAAPG